MFHLGFFTALYGLFPVVLVFITSEYPVGKETLIATSTTLVLASIFRYLWVNKEYISMWLVAAFGLIVIIAFQMFGLYTEFTLTAAIVSVAMILGGRFLT